MHTFCNTFSASVSGSIFVSGNRGPWTLPGCIVLHAGYTGGTPGCLLDHSEAHFHVFGDDFSVPVRWYFNFLGPAECHQTYWLQDVSNANVFQSFGTRVFSEYLCYILRMLPLVMFLAHSCYSTLPPLLLSCSSPCTHSCSYIGIRAATPVSLS